jgi:phage regulator Rha-like protein
MFQLTVEEVDLPRSQFVTLRPGRGQHRKYLPYAFTEQGVVMLSSVLRSQRAVQVNIEIMRAFVRLRQMLQQDADLARKLALLEEKYDAQFRRLRRHPQADEATRRSRGGGLDLAGKGREGR